MDLINIVALVLGVLGALAFLRVTKLENHLRSRGHLEADFDSLKNLEQFNVFDRHRRR